MNEINWVFIIVVVVASLVISFGWSLAVAFISRKAKDRRWLKEMKERDQYRKENFKVHEERLRLLKELAQFEDRK